MLQSEEHKTGQNYSGRGGEQLGRLLTSGSRLMSVELLPGYL